MSVVDANTYAELTSLNVGQILTTGVSQTTRSTAADGDSTVIFVPVPVRGYRCGATA